jgi:16S rRNA (guanine527-N7)-methyltransferase
MRPEEINFRNYIDKMEFKISDQKFQKLFAYLKMLLLANQTTNLTAITDYAEALIKHLYDSLLIINHPVFQDARLILDVGSGGGLPGIPLAICNPGKRFISLEATKKKANFQEKADNELEIKNHTVLWGRSEELAHDRNHREQYDLVIARALAATDTLTELTLPFVALNHYAVFYKAKEYAAEFENAQPALRLLGGLLKEVISFGLPDENGIRNLLLIKKLIPTPSKYPRRPGLPQKAPLK